MELMLIKENRAENDDQVGNEKVKVLTEEALWSRHGPPNSKLRLHSL